MGMSWTGLLDAATGTWPRRASFTMPIALERVSARLGMPAPELLDQHTLFPYVVAYTTPQRYLKLRAAVLTPNVDLHRLSGILHPIRGCPRRRQFCPECLREDIKRFGEGYWHRIHLLPGVDFCAHHEIPLSRTTIAFQRTAGDCSLAVPQELPHNQVDSVLPALIRAAVARKSALALMRPYEPTNWLRRYREGALNLGYRLSGSGLSGSAIAQDLTNFFGSSCLEQFGCEVDQRKRCPWPALLVRPDSPTAHSAVKHVLMGTFLEYAPSVHHLRMMDYAPKGKKPRNYGVLDDEAHRRIRTFLDATQGTGQRHTVKHLLAHSGFGAAYRKHRDWFPKTRRLIYMFRLSSQAFKPLDMISGPATFSRAHRRARQSRVDEPGT